MSHIISPWVFYWISVADVSRTIIALVTVVACLATALLIGYALDPYTDDDDSKRGFHYAKISGAVVGVCVLLCVFIPSEKTCYKMLAADMFTQENIDVASDYVTDVIDYAVDKVKDMKGEGK